jgi:hypothetical protein
MKKVVDDIQNIKRMGQAMSQAPKLGPKHELMWVWCTIEVP